jgi:hypothetical protein
VKAQIQRRIHNPKMNNVLKFVKKSSRKIYFVGRKKSEAKKKEKANDDNCC